MRIIQINVIYGHGSTGRIVETLHRQYEKLGHESYVLFGRGKKTNDPHVIRTGFLFEAKLWRFIQLFTGNTLNGSPLSTWNLKRIIKKIKPHVVHVQLINGNMCSAISFLKWLRRQQFRVVFTHHAKFLFAGGCGINLCKKYEEGCGNCPLHKKEFGRFAPDRTKTLFNKLQQIGFPSWAAARHTFVSPWLQNQAMKSRILSGASMTSIFNPVDTSVFCHEKDGDSVAPCPQPYLFFPSSMAGADTKGANYIDEIATRIKPLGLSLVITENNPNSCLDNIIDVGRINGPEAMARYYRHAEATLVLSLFETFSLPTIESILCGTPVIGFECGGPSTLETGGMATFVPYGNIDALAEAVKSVSKTKTADLSGVYSPKTIADEYLKIYEK